MVMVPRSKHQFRAQAAMFPAMAHSGLSLPELLVAGALGVFLLASVLKAFDSVRGNTEIVRSVADVQDAGWAAIRILERDIGMASFAGCASGDVLVNNFNMRAATTTVGADLTTNLFNEAIFGYTVKSATKWETATGVEDDIYTNIRSNLATGASLVVNSDVVRVTRASSDTADLAGTIEELDDPIVVSAGSNLTFSKGDYVILSDCSSADVVRVSNEPDYTTDPTADVSLEHAVGTDANTVATLSKFYPASAQVRRFNSNFYYVAETGREDTAGNPVRALYRLPFGGEPVELVQGVESMQLLYGELLPTNLIRYSDVEDHSVDWARVVSVRISLLVSGSNAILAPGVSDDKTYTLAGVKIGSPSGSTAIKHPGDRKLRRVFSTTVNLYNKLASTNLAINSVVGP